MATGRGRTYVSGSGQGVQAGRFASPASQFALSAVVSAITSALSFVVTVATRATLSGDTQGINGVPSALVITLNAPAGIGGLVFNLAAPGATLGSATITIAQGALSGGTTITRATTGSTTVTMTGGGGVELVGTPLGYSSLPPGSFAWQVPNDAVLATGRNMSTVLATDVPAGAVCSITPEPLFDQSLVLDGTTLKLVGGNRVPTVSNETPGTLEAAMATQSQQERGGVTGWRIEVLESPLAFCNHIRNGSLIANYGNGFAQPIWFGVQEMARDGDVFEMSPGALAPDESVSPNSYLQPAMLKVNQSITIRGMPGQGYWRLLPPGQVVTNPNKHGVMLLNAQDIAGTDWDYVPTTQGRRKNYSISDGYIVDQCGSAASPIRLRSRPISEASWDLFINSVTIRNFVVGRRTPGVCLSGISGAAEYLTIESGIVVDCGNGSGQEHNLYCDARVMVIRGIRNVRTVGWLGTPWGSGVFPSKEGHMFKLTAESGLIEACVIDCTELGDQSLLAQLKGGNNWVLRGNLWIDSEAPNNAKGMILMDREYNQDGVTPNFPPWCGANGNSLLFEKSVVIGRYPRPIIWFFPHASYPNTALYPIGDTSVGPERRLSPIVIRDNVAAVSTVQRYGNWMISGFPGANNSKWINDDPNAGPTWAARGNTTRLYTRSMLNAFAEEEQAKMSYRLVGGPVAASGTVATHRFVYPYGSIPREDAYQGLG